MKNLLKETIEILTRFGKNTSDVRWVGTQSQLGTWEDFIKIADIEYDCGYGGNEVEGSLVIVGNNWWLERGEYDGSEWWEFKMLPSEPIGAAHLTDIMKC